MSDTFSSRKTVTILFSDLVESTSLAERLDPELLGTLLNQYFGEMRAIVQSHGGTVEKFIGDAVVGLFGVPNVHEDDAIRAVRAALAMHDAIQAMNDEARLPEGVVIGARIGVNTGEVVVTAGGDTGAIGHAVNIAARLEQSARTGEVLIGALTRRLVNGAMDAQEIDSLIVKGSTEPIRAWRVTGELDRSARGWTSATTFVGRKPELRQVLDATEQAVRDQTCVTVMVVAPPGLGKSRLAAEVTSQIGDGMRVLIGRCVPYGEGITYAPLKEIVAQIQAEDGEDAISAVMASEVDGDLVVARISGTASDAAYGSPEDTAWAFRRFFETLAQDGPLLIILDDLHWAAPLMLDLVEYVATFSVGAPMTVLGLARPELFDQRPSLVSPRAHSNLVRLEPLSTEETKALLEASESELDAASRERIAKAAAGVPLFAEQMAAFEQEGQTDIPPTVRALLAARVDRLEPADRLILEAASVEGEVFRRTTVSDLAPESVPGGLGGRLISLVQREFVRPERTGGGPDAFRFNHALIRDAVYEQMPRLRRSELHERFAEILAAVNGATPQDVIGHHLEQAYRELVAVNGADERAIELALRAGKALHAAGTTAIARKEWLRGVELLNRALELLQSDPEARVAAFPELIKAYYGLADYASVDRLREDGTAEARRIGDRTSELRIEMARAPSETSRDLPGWPVRLEAIAQAALEHFGPLGDDRNLAEAWITRSLVYSASDLDARIRALKKAQGHAERGDDEFSQVYIWDELAGSMLFGRTPYPETLDFVRREIAWAEERGIAFTAADGQLGLAYCLIAEGDLAGARATLDELHRLFESLPGQVPQHGESYNVSGSLESFAGNAELALGYFWRANELFAQGEYMTWWYGTVASITHMLLDLGRVDEAAVAIADLDGYAGTASPRARSFELAARARIAAARQDPAGGITLARRAVETASESASIQVEARMREHLAAILEAEGDVSAARQEYEKALDLYSQKVFVPGLVRVQARLNEATS